MLGIRRSRFLPWREPHGVPANPDLVRGLGLFAIQYRKIRFDSKPGCGLDQEGPAGGLVKTLGTSVFPAPLRRNHDAGRKRYLLGHGVSVLARGVGKPDPKRSTSEWSRTIENTCRAALEPAMRADGWRSLRRGRSIFRIDAKSACILPSSNGFSPFGSLCIRWVHADFAYQMLFLVF